MENRSHIMAEVGGSNPPISIYIVFCKTRVGDVN
jgi:hypothetical protein